MICSNQHRAKLSSILDMKAGYQQIPIWEEDKETAFRTSSGKLLQYKMMLFGLCNAPSTFSRLVAPPCLGWSERFVWPTWMTLLSFAKDWEEHLQHLELVLARIQAAGLKLNPEKCNLVQTQLPFLGHVASGEGVWLDPKIVQAIQAFPFPTTDKQTRSFLGLAGYYQRFMKEFSRIATLLHRLLGKDHP